MTKILLVLTVVAMIVLSGLVMYESYRSLQENAGQEDNTGSEESPFHEVYE